MARGVLTHGWKPPERLPSWCLNCASGWC